MKRNHFFKRVQPSGFTTGGVFFLTLCLLLSSCLTVQDPSTYYGKVVVPRSQEFRWSDGGLPQTFDPAFAAAAPDTDAVRALFEGLTDYDPKTLSAVPAVATRWESTGDGRTWTFYLRDDARWSNGDRVTAQDFVRSWKRTLEIGPLAPHTELLANIRGALGNQIANHKAEPTKEPAGFGAEALDDHVLRVKLERSDTSFPALVAHPVFRPVKFSETDPTRRLEANNLISNGAFQLSNTSNTGVSLEPSKMYWDGQAVSLQRVTFVNSTNAEDALSAYRAGEVDAVTNAAFEPLALKLLAPYKDFRRSTFGAVTYYNFNTAREPFDDIRVREALAISIDRDRVSRDDLDGATEPAGKFFPASSSDEPVIGKTALIEQDINKATQLLAEAGFPNGEGFPTVRLLINRNEQQRIVAQAIAEMWKSALNIQTEIIIKNWDEYETAIRAGDYDVVRRGLVMQTTDELTNLRMIFEREVTPLPAATPVASGTPVKETATPEKLPTAPVVESEAQALKELRSMPIYFASSYSLVKPYVAGFDSNVLDISSLKRVRLETNWTDQRP
ncbi:MAG TPA: peptide ABC transporter substrate-binding protein [Pyrinomonadaceae bacterium]|nr:peptide ABC transporter substrate-binding protein [Pyrinomonadaceae bacterium]